MGAIFSLFGKKQERRKVKTCGGCLNALRNNWRGLESVVVAIIILGVFARHEKESSHNVLAIWLCMLVFMLNRPMAVGASALIPVFGIPLMGVLKSAVVCGTLVNENIILFFLGGWLLLLLNNCGLDKRLVCCFLAKGKASSYTPQKLLVKSCFAAFCVSAIAERDLTTQAIMKYLIDALEPVKSVRNEVNAEDVTKVLCNAVAISSFLGSMTIVHASINTLQMRSLFSEAAGEGMELPDVFNYLNYSAYAIPTFLVMFLANLGYEYVLVTKVAGKNPMSVRTKEFLQKQFRKNRQDLGPMTNHEKVSLGFLVLLMFCLFTRWSKWLNYGWATFRQYPTSPDLCAVKDATTAAIFVVILHWLPKSLHFFKICCVKKQGDLPTMQRESGILFWKFIDKSTDYSLFILLGSGAIIYKAMVKSKLNEDMHYFIGEKITKMPHNVVLLLMVLVSKALGGCMPGLGAQACLMPFFLGITMTAAPKWPQRRYLAALAVGVGTGLGFGRSWPHSPSFFVPKLAKMEWRKQCMYSLPSKMICGLILWLSLCFYAPLLWDPHDLGVLPEAVPGEASSKPTPAPPHKGG